MNTVHGAALNFALTLSALTPGQADAAQALKQALQLAHGLSARDAAGLRAVADSNPALVREWMAELAVWHLQTQRDADLFRAVLDALRTAETSRIRDVAA